MKYDNEGLLPGSISTMKKTKREPGSANELKKVMAAAAVGPLSPIIAPVINPVVGSGLGGAILTNMINPTNSEASLLLDLGKTAKRGLRGKNNKTWNLGGREVFEQTTRLPSMRSANIAPEFMNSSRHFTGFDDIKNITLKDFVNKGLTTKQASDAFRGLKPIRNHNIKIANEFENSLLMNNPNMHGYANIVDKEAFIRGAKSNMKNDINSFRNTVDHEAGHLIQADNPKNLNRESIWLDTERQMNNNSDLEFDDYLNLGHEMESRISGRRAGYGPLLTNPSSKFGIHPLLTYNKERGSFTLNDAVNYVGNEVKNGRMTKKESNDFIVKDILPEADRLNKLVKSNNKLKAVLDGRFSKPDKTTSLGMDMFK